MKGIQGIVIAAGLGIVGAVCNWWYIDKQARDFEKVSFVVIASDAQINSGDRLKEEHFARVDIPKQNMGNLDKVAYLWKDRQTAVGFSATRSYRGNEILLRQDLQTPPRRDLSQLLAENEALRWVPVDPRSFVAEHVNPGDHVSFIVPQVSPGGPAPAGRSRLLRPAATQTIGPFEILALGNRKGRREILKAQGRSTGRENLVGIRVTIVDGDLDPKSKRLFELLRLTNHQGVQVMLHSSRKKESEGT